MRTNFKNYRNKLLQCLRATPHTNIDVLWAFRFVSVLESNDEPAQWTDLLHARTRDSHHLLMAIADARY